MNGKRFPPTYDKQFSLFSARIERYLRGALVALLLALLIAQALLTIPSVRHVATRIDPLEGEPFPQTAWSDARTAKTGGE